MLRYDVEPISERPHNIWLNNAIAPPVLAALKLKRRTLPTEAAVSS